MSAEQGLAVVIGGAAGIGATTAQLMTERGWRVVVADRDEAAGERLAGELDAGFRRIDIAREDDIREAAAAIEERHGRVSGLVVAAAVYQAVVPPRELTLTAWNAVLQVNLTGTFLANREFGSRMAASGGGAIVNIASIAAIGSMPVHAYGTSKAGVVHLTSTLAGAWGRSGVRVNVVTPGSTLVPRVEERIRSGRYAADPAEFTALGRMVRPREVAEVIEFLASSRASAITGQNIVVDAGWQVASTWAQFGGVPGPEGAVDPSAGGD